MALRLFAPAPLRISPTFIPFAFALPISITIPPLLADLWESVLRAVPKKKTSHMKKRHRQMAGKALKDVQSLNKCPGCGQVKRAHLLCPHCVRGIRGRRRRPPHKGESIDLDNDHDGSELGWSFHDKASPHLTSPVGWLKLEWRRRREMQEH
ncbi:unnamed protein product [Penicillium manginii]